MANTNELSSAISLILAGRTEEAMKTLNDFELNNPESPLLSSIRQAREKLLTLPKKS